MGAQISDLAPSDEDPYYATVQKVFPGRIHAQNNGFLSISITTEFDCVRSGELYFPEHFLF